MSEFNKLPPGKQVIIGSKYDPLYRGIDASTGALNAISYEHHEVHHGRSYHISEVVSVSTTTQLWLITTPDLASWAHMIFGAECTGEMLIIVTEGADRTTGTELTPINHNRNCTGTAEVRVQREATGGSTNGATTIFTKRVGATGQGSKTINSGEGRSINEYVLKQNTKYVVSITTYAASQVSLSLDWYEHTDVDDAITTSVSPSLSPSLSPSISPSLSSSMSPSISPSISPST